jgi:hypothetical protein
LYASCTLTSEKPLLLGTAAVSPNNQTAELDPFLLLDHFGPAELKLGEALRFRMARSG